jgi:flavodoxin
MKTLVIYYSFSGSTKEIAEKYAKEKSNDIIEIKDEKPLAKFKAYTTGILAARNGTAWAIKPIDVDYSSYERIVLLAPVWANNPPPAFWAYMKQLPFNKTISIKMVSMSGKSNCKDRLSAIIEAKSCRLESFEDINV